MISMDFKLTKNFIEKTVGKVTLKFYLDVRDIKENVLTYIVPWLAIIAVIMNLIVFILCLIIYWKTKKVNHKPAFVFIGFLAIMDVLNGLVHVRYVYKIQYI